MSGTLFFLVLFTSVHISQEKPHLHMQTVGGGQIRINYILYQLLWNQTDNLSFLSPWTQAANHQNWLLTTQLYSLWTIYTKKQLNAHGKMSK